MMTMQKQGRVYNLVLASRMPTVEAFTRWKEGQRAALPDITSEFTKTFGKPLAESITGTMGCCESTGIPSIQIQIHETFIHLPPKIAYLIRLAYTDCEKVADQFWEYLQEKPDTAHLILAEIAMGKPRLETVCCCARISDLVYLRKRYHGRDAGAIYTLESAQYNLAEGEVFARTVNSIGLVHDRGKLTRELVCRILSSENGMFPYKSSGEVYLAGSEDPLFAEAAVQLGTITEGSVLRTFRPGSR